MALALISCLPHKPVESMPSPTPAPMRAEPERKKELLSALNFDFSGLEKVKLSVAALGFDTAIRELAANYRSRTKPVWLV